GDLVGGVGLLTDKSSTGLGDIAVGIGPRGTVGNFHWLSYAGLIFPTGSEDASPALGNGRTDLRVGLFTTYLAENKTWELDTSLEYTLTGNGAAGDPPDELAFGAVAGGRISERFRLAGGMTETRKESGDHIANARVVLRYTPSKRHHLELLLDRAIASEGIPRTTAATLIYRRNVGKLD
ncbi:MAG TPA: transporter, partial [Candidatus Nanoarchaeia archaeon]|nr:transporter [Candidatus Nanoarchaeia archaeon]